MALVKKHTIQDIEELPILSNLDEAVDYFKSQDDIEKKRLCYRRDCKISVWWKFLSFYNF